MKPIVDGLKNLYNRCIQLERVNFHERTAWHDLLSPFATPEFVLLDSQNNVLYRWFGTVEAEEFAAVLDPLCKG
ncbi:MAG TPA: hypothetical protein PKK96_12390 [Anaerolineales bacterium]|nr:hypothetical protein [Anaerolineales bacterium]HNS61799.1 hypothetical protein [Anaerolineales bacterium]